MKRLMMAAASVLVSAPAFYGFTAPARARDLGSDSLSSARESGRSVREDSDLAETVSAARDSVPPGESVFVGTVNGYALYLKEDVEGCSTCCLVRLVPGRLCRASCRSMFVERWRRCRSIGV